MTMPGLAGRAVATPLEWHDGHLVPGLPSDDTGADRIDGAGHLVPDGPRRGDPVVHGSVGDLEVRPAYPGEGDSDADLTRAGLGGLVEPRSEDSVAVVVEGEVGHEGEATVCCENVSILQS